MRKDLILHFSICAIISVCVALYQYCLYLDKGAAMSAAFLTAMAAAVTKEWADDIYRNGWDWLDLLADVLGAVVALTLFALFV